MLHTWKNNLRRCDHNYWPPTLLGMSMITDSMCFSFPFPYLFCCWGDNDFFLDTQSCQFSMCILRECNCILFLIMLYNHHSCLWLTPFQWETTWYTCPPDILLDWAERDQIPETLKCPGRCPAGQVTEYWSGLTVSTFLEGEPLQVKYIYLIFI